MEKTRIEKLSEELDEIRAVAYSTANIIIQNLKGQIAQGVYTPSPLLRCYLRQYDEACSIRGEKLREMGVNVWREKK